MLFGFSINILASTDFCQLRIEINIIRSRIQIQKIYKSKKIKDNLINQMTNFQTIANAFRKIGINENSFVTQSQMLRALDRLAQSNGMNQFDRNVAEEIWAQTQKEQGNKVLVQDYIGTLIKGEGLVKSSINDLERQIQTVADANQKDYLLQDLASYSEDLKFLTIPFGLRTSGQNSKFGESHYSNLDGNQSRYSGNSTVIFAKQIPERQSGSSTDLKIAFLLTCILTFVQLIVMFHKHHFLSLLAYLSVLGIYFLGNFDMHYMRFVKILLMVSVVLDVAWVFVNGPEYWNPYAQTQHSSLQWAFLKFVIFFVVGMAIFKVILAAILFKYRNNPSTLRKNVEMCGERYNLSGRPNSLLAKVINGTQDHQGYYEPTEDQRNKY